MSKCETTKSRFKVGDEVYYISTVNGNRRIGVVKKIEETPKSNIIWATWGGGAVITGWMPEDKVFFVNPPESVGFEVGKKYKHNSLVFPEIEILFIGNTHAFVRNVNGEHLVLLKFFNKYCEYTPPPPEEWRIVYKDKYGNVTVGKVPFKSDSEAKASYFWTDHPTTAFKTIRVDA